MLKIVFLTKGHAEMSKAWKGQDCNEAFARLYYIESGEAEIWHHGERIILQPGSLYLIPSGSNMRYRCRNSFSVVWVHFNIALYGRLDLFATHSANFSYIPENSKQVEVDMLKLISMIDCQDILSQLRAKSLLLDLISNFFICQTDAGIAVEQGKTLRLTPVLRYIDKNLGRQIKLAELAKLAAYEQTYFSALFKQIFSLSPIKYIQNKRIEKAQSMLRNSNMKLSAIADELGYNDAFHFSKTFKRITGENPSEFRRRIPRRMP